MTAPLEKLKEKMGVKSEGEKVKVMTPYGKKHNPKAKSGGTYMPKGMGNGGARPGSGRIPGGTALQKRIIKGILYEHFVGSRTIQVTNQKTGKVEIIQKPNSLIQIEKLFMIGQNNNDAHAIDLWLNRAIGKASQPIVGDEDDDPVQLNVGIGRLINKSYGEENDGERNDKPKSP